MTEHPRAVYNDVKNILRNEFCGDDYKCALEPKSRCTKFTRSTDISTFCPQLKQIIQELYNIVEPDTVELIAVNHIIAELEPSLRESVKILQLTGHARLENVLELIKSKMVSEMSNISQLSPTFNAAATVPNYVSQQDRFDRLEIINLLATATRKGLIKKIQRSPFYSIMMDATSDISRIDQLCHYPVD